MTASTIGPNTKVQLHFSLSLNDGTLIDSTREKDRAEFVFGDGNILPNMEKLLVGMASGENRSFILPANKAFGEYNEENLQAIPRTDFDAGMKLEQGLLVAFADSAGGELPGLVKSVNEQFVMIDFNHPLAGKEIIFEVEILSVEKLNAESLINWIESHDSKLAT